MAKKSSWKDRLFAALRSKDEAEREELLREAEGMPEGDDSDEHTHEGDGHHIVVNVTAPPAEGNEKAPKPPKPTEDEEGDDPEESTDMDEDKVNEMIATANAPILETLTALKEAVEALAPRIAETAEKVDDLEEAVDDMSDPEDMATQDAVARAAILAPSLARPTSDAKPGSKSHRDAMGSFKKDALRAALTTDTGRAAVHAVLGHTQIHRISGMTPAETNVAFRAASQLMLDHNAARTVDTLTSATSGYVRDEKGTPVRPMTAADLQAKANAFYKRSA